MTFLPARRIWARRWPAKLTDFFRLAARIENTVGVFASRRTDFQPAPPHRDSSTPSIDAASASLEYRGAAARAAAASRWRSTELPASLSIAAAIAAGFSGGTQTPHFM